MSTFISHLRLITTVAVAVLFTVVVPQANANFTLQYTGNSFDPSLCVPGGEIAGCLSGNLSLTIEVSGDALPPNYTGTLDIGSVGNSTTVVVAGQSFNMVIGGSITFSSGAVTSWSLGLPVGEISGTATFFGGFTSNYSGLIQDQITIYYSGPIYLGQNINDPGVWTSSSPHICLNGAAVTGACSSGTDITGAGTGGVPPRTVVVGQGISVSATPPATPQSWALYDPNGNALSWSSAVVGGFTVSGCPSPPVPVTGSYPDCRSNLISLSDTDFQTTAQPPKFYWTKPSTSVAAPSGTYRVDYKYTDATGAVSVVSTFFEVEGPAPLGAGGQFISTGEPGGFIIGTSDDGTWYFAFDSLRYHDGAAGNLFDSKSWFNYGIKFTPQMTTPPDYLGKITWVQIIDQYEDINNGRTCTSNGIGLDNTYPYRPHYPAGESYFPDGSMSISDGPGVAVNQTLTARLEFAADMYLLWQPTADSTGTALTDTIPVPLAYVDWAFDSFAQRSQGAQWTRGKEGTDPDIKWATPSDLIVQGQVLNPSYPQWTTLSVNGARLACSTSSKSDTQ